MKRVLIVIAMAFAAMLSVSTPAMAGIMLEPIPSMDAGMLGSDAGPIADVNRGADVSVGSAVLAFDDGDRHPGGQVHAVTAGSVLALQHLPDGRTYLDDGNASPTSIDRNGGLRREIGDSA